MTNPSVPTPERRELKSCEMPAGSDGRVNLRIPSRDACRSMVQAGTRFVLESGELVQRRPDTVVAPTVEKWLTGEDFEAFDPADHKPMVAHLDDFLNPAFRKPESNFGEQRRAFGDSRRSP